MKYYRLSQSHPSYGILGNAIPEPEWKETIPWMDKALFDPTDEQGSTYPYKAEVRLTASAAAPMLFFMHDYAELIILISILQERGRGTSDKPVIVPRTDTAVTIGTYSVKIIYRKEWDDE